MKIFISENYDEMCRRALNHILQLLASIKNPLICPASGDTPAGLYKNLVSDVELKKIEINNWSFVGLDEWMGMNGNDQGSCRFHLNNQLFKPLNVKESQISFFDGRENDTNNECVKVEDFIFENGGIEVAIVGIGMNGHVGMNEPGTSKIIRSHVTEIHSETKISGQKYFTEKQELLQGITLGLANILEAHNIFLLASGQHKADIIKQVLEGEISDQFPSSLLREHPALYIYLDNEAADLLKKETIKN